MPLGHGEAFVGPLNLFMKNSGSLAGSTGMKITEFTKVENKRGRTPSTWAYRMESEPSELSAEQKASRWYAAFGESVIEVTRVRVAIEMLFGGKAQDWSSKSVCWDTYTVVCTAFGFACIVDFKDGSEVQGFIAAASGKAPCMTLGTWRKYRAKRGHGMAWLRIHAALGLCKSPEKGRDVCPAEAYAALAGKRYGVSA